MSLIPEDCLTDFNINLHKYHLRISDSFQNENGISKFSYINIYGDDDIYKRKIRRSILENHKTKHYLKLGEDCSICFDGIWRRKDAFLTDCGHSFHLSCIIEYDYKNSFAKLGVFCPICRNDMGIYNDLKDRYKSSKNYLDILEDFELNIKDKLPKICSNHFHRFRYKDCYYCSI